MITVKLVKDTPRCFSMLRIAENKRQEYIEMWRTIGGTTCLIGAPAPNTDNLGCDADTCWLLLGGPLFDFILSKGQDAQPLVCRHMIDAGD
jgi:hypothetical protein